ncbi:hypothetical protein SESBI_41815 [Sesbania bispinosa]|nr:hypothetical protein SESBI_41815 [Sesbania bispinosa]
MEGRNFLFRHEKWMIASGNHIRVGKHTWVAAGDNLTQFIQGDDFPVANLMLENVKKMGPNKNKGHVP